MINRLQKSLWIVSSASPICITFSVAWYLNKPSYQLSISFFVTGFLLLIIAFLIFQKMKRQLPTMHLKVRKVTQNDKIITAYIVSYLLPFASIAFDKYNPFIFLGIAFVFFIILIVSHSPTVNPLLFFIGYHFYEVESESGIGNYMVISKKTVRNKDEFKTITRITEYLLIDTTEVR